MWTTCSGGVDALVVRPRIESCCCGACAVCCGSYTAPTAPDAPHSPPLAQVVFSGAKAFNQDVDSWDVAKVTEMAVSASPLCVRGSRSLTVGAVGGRRW